MDPSTRRVFGTIAGRIYNIGASTKVAVLKPFLESDVRCNTIGWQRSFDTDVCHVADATAAFVQVLDLYAPDPH